MSHVTQPSMLPSSSIAGNLVLVRLDAAGANIPDRHLMEDLTVSSNSSFWFPPHSRRSLGSES